ncbi:MAG TPA: SDR family NAD(P)-dependent oxidoreductase, partial [Solimonas sp.]|nr:SDR family NAD(P)-dependent oxidoreductase [Solimonas sp.]
MARMELRGKVVAVTGAARGIGLEIARALVAQGAQVSIGDIDEALAQAAAKPLGAHA